MSEIRKVQPEAVGKIAKILADNHRNWRERENKLARVMSIFKNWLEKVI